MALANAERLRAIARADSETVSVSPPLDDSAALNGEASSLAILDNADEDLRCQSDARLQRLVDRAVSGGRRARISQLGTGQKRTLAFLRNAACASGRGIRVL